MVWTHEHQCLLRTVTVGWEERSACGQSVRKNDGFDAEILIRIWGDGWKRRTPRVSDNQTCHQGTVEVAFRAQEIVLPVQNWHFVRQNVITRRAGCDLERMLFVVKNPAKTSLSGNRQTEKRVSYNRAFFHSRRLLSPSDFFCMSDATNFCLKGPRGQVVGFRLGAENLGHEIYDILDWADEHFSSHFVEQTDGHVYVCSESAREALKANELQAEPLSIGGPDGRSGGGPAGGGLSGGGGPSGGGSSGGSSGPGGNVPAGSDGGETVAETSGL